MGSVGTVFVEQPTTATARIHTDTPTTPLKMLANSQLAVRTEVDWQHVSDWNNMKKCNAELAQSYRDQTKSV